LIKVLGATPEKFQQGMVEDLAIDLGPYGIKVKEV
jgi:hypothetical protein